MKILNIIIILLIIVTLNYALTSKWLNSTSRKINVNIFLFLINVGINIYVCMYYTILRSLEMSHAKKVQIN